jgi:hypothetical protein
MTGTRVAAGLSVRTSADRPRLNKQTLCFTLLGERPTWDTLNDAGSQLKLRCVRNSFTPLGFRVIWAHAACCLPARTAAPGYESPGESADGWARRSRLAGAFANSFVQCLSEIRPGDGRSSGYAGDNDGAVRRLLVTTFPSLAG